MSSSSDAVARSFRLSIAQIRLLALASLGGALEFYDFVIFALLAKPIALNFFPGSQAIWLRQVEVFGLFGTGYLARPLGGIVMAHFGDVSGRKKVFTFSVLLMALPTFVMSVLPGYARLGVAAPLALLALRVMQGAAIGAEAPGGWVFVAEHAPPGRVGLATGLLTGGLTGGIFLGSIVILALYALLPSDAVNDWGWRLPFALGGFLGLAAMVLRSWLEETPVFQEMRETSNLADSMPLKVVLRDHRGAIVCSMLATWTLTSAVVVLILMMPSLMQVLHHTVPFETMAANLVATLCLTCSVVITGALTDRFSFNALTLSSAALLAVGACILYVLPNALDFHKLIIAAAVSGLCCGFVALVPIAMLRAFPAPVRFSGLSFSYNVAYAIFGGLTPIFIALMIPYTSFAPAIYVSCLAVIGAVALLLSPIAR